MKKEEQIVVAILVLGAAFVLSMIPMSTQEQDDTSSNEQPYATGLAVTDDPSSQWGSDMLRYFVKEMFYEYKKYFFTHEDIKLRFESDDVIDRDPMADCSLLTTIRNLLNDLNIQVGELLQKYPVLRMLGLDDLQLDVLQLVHNIDDTMRTYCGPTSTGPPPKPRIPPGAGVGVQVTDISEKDMIDGKPYNWVFDRHFRYSPFGLNNAVPTRLNPPIPTPMHYVPEDGAWKFWAVEGVGLGIVLSAGCVHTLLFANEAAATTFAADAAAVTSATGPVSAAELAAFIKAVEAGALPITEGAVASAYNSIIAMGAVAFNTMYNPSNPNNPPLPCDTFPTATMKMSDTGSLENPGTNPSTQLFTILRTDATYQPSAMQQPGWATKTTGIEVLIPDMLCPYLNHGITKNDDAIVATRNFQEPPNTYLDVTLDPESGKGIGPCGYTPPGGGNSYGRYKGYIGITSDSGTQLVDTACAQGEWLTLTFTLPDGPRYLNWLIKCQSGSNNVMVSNGFVTEYPPWSQSFNPPPLTFPTTGDVTPATPMDNQPPCPGDPGNGQTNSCYRCHANTDCNDNNDLTTDTCTPSPPATCQQGCLGKSCTNTPVEPPPKTGSDAENSNYPSYGMQKSNNIQGRYIGQGAQQVIYTETARTYVDSNDVVHVTWSSHSNIGNFAVEELYALDGTITKATYMGDAVDTTTLDYHYDGERLVEVVDDYGTRAISTEFGDSINHNLVTKQEIIWPVGRTKDGVDVDMRFYAGYRYFPDVEGKRLVWAWYTTNEDELDTLMAGNDPDYYFFWEEKDPQKKIIRRDYSVETTATYDENWRLLWTNSIVNGDLDRREFDYNTGGYIIQERFITDAGNDGTLEMDTIREIIYDNENKPIRIIERTGSTVTNYDIRWEENGPLYSAFLGINGPLGAVKSGYVLDGKGPLLPAPFFNE